MGSMVNILGRFESYPFLTHSQLNSRYPFLNFEKSQINKFDSFLQILRQNQNYQRILMKTDERTAGSATPESLLNLWNLFFLINFAAFWNFSSTQRVGKYRLKKNYWWEEILCSGKLYILLNPSKQLPVQIQQKKH